MSTFEIKIKESQLDIDELKTLLNQSNRPNIKQILSSNLERLESDLVKLQKSEQDRLARLNTAANGNNAKLYTKKIDTYGWDQSEKFVKIYITSLTDVNKVKESDVTCEFGEKSFDLTIKNLNNANYNLIVNNLLNKIDPQGSYVKCKTDMIAVFLKKLDVGKNWAYVTEKEMKSKESKLATPKMDENADPQEGLMSIMKKMYEEGDDEMKRTITKAFVESREKSTKGGGIDDGMGGMGGLGGLGGMGDMSL